MSYRSRVTPVRRPADHPACTDPTVRKALDSLFEHVCPGQDKPEIDDAHAGIAIAAHNPALALQLAQLSRFIALELPFCARSDLRELVILAVNTHFGCEYALQSRIAVAEAAGISREMQSALGAWERSHLFNEEQHLVIEFAFAVASGAVADELFARVVGEYGEAGAVELSTVAGFWSFWALLLNAVGVVPNA